jgi:hypothetical protein
MQQQGRPGMRRYQRRSPQQQYAGTTGVNYAQFQDDSADEAAMKKASDAEGWANAARVGGSVLGTAAGGLIGGLAGGIPTGGAGAIPGIGIGAGIGGTIGAGLGNMAGDAISKGGQEEIDKMRARKMKEEAMMLALSGMRGF